MATQVVPLLYGGLLYTTLIPRLLQAFVILSMYSLYVTEEAQELRNKAGPCLREE